MFQVAGASIGLGVTTAIFTASARSEVHSSAIVTGPSPAPRSTRSTACPGHRSAHNLLAPFPQTRAALTSIAHQAFATGVQTAFTFTAALALIACVVTAVFIKGRPRLHAAAAAEPSAAAA